MLTGSTDALSNQATWRQPVKCTDDETYAIIDLEPLIEEITVSIRIPDEDDDSEALLTASYTDGTVTFLVPGVFEFIFTKTQMATLCPGEYEVGVLIKYLDAYDGDTVQGILGEVPILRGL